MPRFVRENLAGWGNVPIEPCDVSRPMSLRELRQAVTSGAPPSLISRGLGRSYGDAALNAHAGVILHDQLDRMMRFDEATGMLEAEAGLTFHDLVDTFLPRGWFLPVTPGTKYVTLGGALAANVHGKNQHRDGCIAAHVPSLQLLTAEGETLNLSREQQPDLFWATFGGMGLTGSIVSAALQLMRIDTAYARVCYRKPPHLDALLDAMQAHDADHRYSVAWIDCMASGASLGRAVLMHGDHATVDDLPASLRDRPLHLPRKRNKNVPCFAPNGLLNPLVVRLFNALYYRRHREETRLVDLDSFFYPLDAVLHWNRLYGRRGFYQYQAVLPLQSSREGLRAVLRTLAASRRASFLAVLKTFGQGDDSLLGFARPGHTLALDIANTGENTRKLLHELDRMVIDHGGRVYLAKDACLTAESFEAMYDNADRFRAIKKRVDPENRFASSLARRLGLISHL